MKKESFEDLILWLNDPSNGQLIENPDLFVEDVFYKIMERVLESSKTTIKDVQTICNSSFYFRKLCGNYQVWKRVFIRHKKKFNCNLDSLVELFDKVENPFLLYYAICNTYLNTGKRKILCHADSETDEFIISDNTIQLMYSNSLSTLGFIGKIGNLHSKHLEELDLLAYMHRNGAYVINTDNLILTVYQLLLKGWNFNYEVDAKRIKINCHLCQTNAFYICGGCNETQYCGIQCQKTDWKNHQLICRPNFL